MSREDFQDRLDGLSSSRRETSHDDRLRAEMLQRQMLAHGVDLQKEAKRAAANEKRRRQMRGIHAGIGVSIGLPLGFVSFIAISGFISDFLDGTLGQLDPLAIAMVVGPPTIVVFVVLVAKQQRRKGQHARFGYAFAIAYLIFPVFLGVLAVVNHFGLFGGSS